MGGDRQQFVDWVKQMAADGNHWYIWGAQGPEYFDCSGFVCYGGYKAGLWPSSFDTTADGFWKTYAHVEHPEPGDLCLYGASPRRATHVTVYVGGGRQVGASGGGSRTTSVATARARNARVKGNTVDYRSDFLGHVRLPFAPPPPSTDIVPFRDCARAVQWCQQRGYVEGDGEGHFVNLPLTLRIANMVLARAGRPALPGGDPHAAVTRADLQAWIASQPQGSGIDILAGKPGVEQLKLISLCFVLYWLGGGQ